MQLLWPRLCKPETQCDTTLTAVIGSVLHYSYSRLSLCQWLNWGWLCRGKSPRLSDDTQTRPTRETDSRWTENQWLQISHLTELTRPLPLITSVLSHSAPQSEFEAVRFHSYCLLVQFASIYLSEVPPTEAQQRRPSVLPEFRWERPSHVLLGHRWISNCPSWFSFSVLVVTCGELVLSVVTKSVHVRPSSPPPGQSALKWRRH